MGTRANVLYGEIVDIVSEYFGPATDRFVARQIHNHLDKEPSELKRQDLLRLIEWINLSLALIIEDERLLRKCVADLKSLAESNHR